MVKQTRTFNCAECKIEVTLEEDSKYPRKYCLNCSAEKKKAFEQGKTATTEDIELEYDTSGDLAPKVVKPGTALNMKDFTNPEVIYTTGKKKDNGFHLTPENCRAEALKSAIEYHKDVTTNWPEEIRIAKEFEKYIVTGD